MTFLRQCAILIFTVSACAIATAQSPEIDTAPIRSIIISVPRSAPPTVTGAPIVYERAIQRHQKAYVVETITRDTAGRMRIERRAIDRRPGRPSTGPPMIVELYDPASGSLYTLDDSRHIAHRMKVISETGRAIEMPANNFETPGANVKQTDLGTDTINGIQAEGRREIKTLSNGATVITETWTSPELKVVLLLKQLEWPANQGVMLINLSPDPPGASFFTVPKNYTVIEETGPFTIEFEK